MPEWVQITVVLGLFIAGLRLSAFFSGSETGFYRLSLPRLGIDAQAGDKEAARLLWFAHRPSQFVATTLVGNNVANYLITVAVTNGTLLVAGATSELTEILATLAVSPVIFLFGELLPKNVYYRAPLARMRRQILWFRAFYLFALPASTPLVMLTRWVEKLSGAVARSQEMLPGRGRFQQMISHGHREGLLTQAQSTMATGVLVIAAQPVSDSMTPGHRVLGVSERATQDQVFEFARRYGTPVVALYADEEEAVSGKTSGDSPRWTAYVTVGELKVRRESVAALKHAMPQIPFGTTKLEALSMLHDQSSSYGAIVGKEGEVLGTVSQRGLVEQLFRPHPRIQRERSGA